MKRYFTRSAQKGFTLIELLLSIAVILALSIGAFIVYVKVKDKADTQTETTNLSTLQTSIKALYAGQSSYTGLTNQVAIQGGSVPSTMTVPGDTTTILNAFKGNVTIATTSVGAGASGANAFTITYPNVPQNVCVNLGTGPASNFDVATINGQPIKTYGGVISVPNVTQQCAAGATNNTMVFTSK